MNFSWPWQYNFPPFFTLQPNVETERKQLEAWRNLILEYCRFHKIYTLDVQESLSSPLFQNKSINRSLMIEAVHKVLESLKEQNRLEWCDKSKKQCFVFWRTPEEWGNLVYSYVSDQGMTNAVCTFYELLSGDDVQGQEFAGMSQEMLVKALKTLESRKKAEIMIFDGNEGVKFF